MNQRTLQAHVHGFQPLTQPFARERALGETPSPGEVAKGVDALALEINDRLETLDAKVYGRIALSDMNGATRKLIHNKLSADEYQTDRDGLITAISTLDSAVSQNAQQIALRVTRSEYDAEKVFRSETAPVVTEAGALWLDTAQTPPLLKRWTGEGWEVVGTSRVAASGLTVEGDAVTIATPNFNLDILNDRGDPVISMHADDAGFDTLYADQIVSPSVMTVGSGGRTLTVGEGGDYATIADALESLPYHLDGTVTLRLVSDLTENVTIKGGKWIRYMTLNLGGFTLYGTVSVMCLDSPIAITDGTIVDGRAAAESSGSTVSFNRVFSALLERVVVCGSGKADNGVYLLYSNCYIADCDIYSLGSTHYAAACIKASHPGRVLVYNTRGTGKYGVSSIYGAEVVVNGAPKGNTANSYRTNGEVIEQSAVYTASAYADSTGQSAPVSYSFTSTGGGSYRSDGYTETTGVFQGAYTPGKYKRGMWFFDHAAIRSALAGKTIKSVTFTCTRFASANGYASPQTPTFYYHNYSSLPSTTPTFSGTGTTGVAWDRGDKKTITLPVAWGNALRDGTARGIAIYAGNNVATPYVKFQPVGATLTVTCV